MTPRLIQGAAFFACLLAASVCDLRRREIPDVFPALIFAAGLINFSPAAFSGLLLGLPFYCAALWQEKGIGGGDIKLVAASGFMLGLPAGALGLITGLTALLLFHGAARYFHRQTARAYPLAPFLSIGFAAAFIISITGGIT